MPNKMSGIGNKSLSETNIAETAEQTTPTNYVYQRAKRGRELDFNNAELDSFKDEMINLISSMMTAHNDELKKIYPTLLEIKNTNTNIENVMAALSAQNEELKKKIGQLEIQSKKDNEQILILEDKIESLQRGSCKNTIEIKNVPKVTKESKEDLLQMVITLSENVDYPIIKKDINDIYRARTKRTETKNGPIIIELSSTLVKTDFMKKMKEFNRKNPNKICAKHLGFKTDVDTPVFVSEKLTTKGARLHFLARDLTKSGKFKFCWTSYGVVYVKKDDNSPTIIIKSEGQVHSLMQD